MTNQRKVSIMRRMKGLMLKRMHGMITCKEFEDFVLSYLEGDLPARQRSRFDWHIKICRECREYLSAYQAAVALGKAVLPSPDDPVPEDVPEDLIRAILDSREQ